MLAEIVVSDEIFNPFLQLVALIHVVVVVAVAMEVAILVLVLGDGGFQGVGPL